VKQAVPDVPVFAVHRILTPDEAEGILADGAADAVTIVRALIADPEWANKAHADHADEIRACTGCNQGCYGNLTQGYPISCVTNPSVGRESTLGSGTLTPAATRRKVVVVGGGPAGLEAAWVAAARGHDVTLTSARPSSVARSASPRCFPDAWRWRRSPTGARPNARGAASTCGSASTPTAPPCSHSSPTRS
jgi:NADPH-dependent 2,4-dienoyl-CoA reductase/sulfur reductase-like enzyme